MGGKGTFYTYAVYLTLLKKFNESKKKNLV